MKKYILVLLIMIIGRIFCSDFDGSVSGTLNHTYTINGVNYTVSFPQSDLTGPHDYTETVGGIEIKFYGQTIKKIIIKKTQIKLTDWVKTYKEKLSSLYKRYGIEQKKLLEINVEDLSYNPYADFVPKAFAAKFDLNLSDLKPRLGGLRYWLSNLLKKALGKKISTPEELFALRLQNTLINKIKDERNTDKTIKLLKELFLAEQLAPDVVISSFSEILDALVNKSGPNMKDEILKRITGEIRKKQTLNTDFNDKLELSMESTLSDFILKRITDQKVRVLLLQASKEMANIDKFDLFLSKCIVTPNIKYNSSEDSMMRQTISPRGGTTRDDTYQNGKAIETDQTLSLQQLDEILNPESFLSSGQRPNLMAGEGFN